MTNRLLFLIIAVLLDLVVEVRPVWAVQAHGGAEGLVSHQIGHFLFTAGMACLLFRLKALHFKGPGWAEFKIFLCLLIAWNLVTFTGHWMNEFVAGEKFLKEDAKILSFTIESLPDAIYYMTRLDHLVLVPSFAFLLLALRKWRLAQ